MTAFFATLRSDLEVMGEDRIWPGVGDAVKLNAARSGIGDV
jgi:hypothetical protein